MPFPVRCARTVLKPSATIAVTDNKQRAPQSGRPQTSSVSAPGRTRFRHARPTSSSQRSMPSRAGKTKYTAVDGHSRAEGGDHRQVSSAKNGLTYKPNQVIVGTGGKQVLYNALMATINPGDEVHHPSPLLGELSGGWWRWPAASRCRWCATAAHGFKLQPGRTGEGDHAEGPNGSSSARHRIRPAPPIRRVELKALDRCAGQASQRLDHD